MENNGEEKIIPQIDVVESPKKDHHIFTVSLLVLCATASLAVFAYTNLYLYKQAFEQASAVEASVVQVDETKDWKIYKSDEYGFEFKYPVDWVYENSLKKTEDVVLKLALNQKDFAEKLKNFEGGVSDTLTLEVFNGVFSTKNDLLSIVKKLDIDVTSLTEYSAESVLGFKANAGPNHFGGGSYFFFSDGKKMIVFWYSDERGLDHPIISTFKFISPEVDNRILLTDKILESLYASTTLSLCKEKLNFDEPNTSVIYRNSEKSISFEIPYNTHWGTVDYKISPYDDEPRATNSYVPNTTGYGMINFGRLTGADGCSWQREITMWFLSPKSANSILLDLKSDPMLVQMGEPSIVSINGLEVVKYTDYGYSSYPTFIVIGKKYNYAFSSGYVEFDDLEKIVKTVKLIK